MLVCFFVCEMHLQLPLPISLYRQLYNDNKGSLILSYLILIVHRRGSTGNASHGYAAFLYQGPGGE